MSILDSIVSGADVKHFNERKDRVPNNYDAKKADQDLRACPVCSAVWEVMVFNQTVDYKYYHNFPRYGKKKGEAVFYAMENSGKLKGVKKKKNTRNK